MEKSLSIPISRRSFMKIGPLIMNLTQNPIKKGFLVKFIIQNRGTLCKV